MSGPNHEVESPLETPETYDSYRSIHIRRLNILQQERVTDQRSILRTPAEAIGCAVVFWAATALCTYFGLQYDTDTSIGAACIGASCVGPAVLTLGLLARMQNLRLTDDAITERSDRLHNAQLSRQIAREDRERRGSDPRLN